jgi:hypothetical protein
MGLSIPDIFMPSDPLADSKTLANIQVETTPVPFTPENMHIDASTLMFDVSSYAEEAISLSV